MGVFLTILKVIGIVLLVLISVILLLLIIILAAPINYRGTAVFDEKPDVRIKVGWLLFVRFLLDFVDQTLDYRLKLLGIRVFPKKEKKEEPKKEKAFEEPADSNKTEVKTEVKTEITDRIEASEAKIEAKASSTAEDEEKEEEEEEEEEEKVPFTRKIEEALEKFIRIWDNTVDAIEDEDKKVSTFFKRKTTKESIEWIKELLIKLLKHIRPRKIEGELEYGFDDPALTGYITAGASLIYDVYEESFELTPNFNESVIKGRVSFKGHMVLGYIVFIALRLYLRKHFRMFIKNAKALKNDTMDNIEKIKDGITNYG